MNLILKMLQMLQNGIIILTIVWSLLRMVDFTHDSGLFDIWSFSVQRIYSVSKLLSYGYSSRKLQNTFEKLYGRHTQLVHTFDTSVSHMLKGLFNENDIWLVSSYFMWILRVNRDGCHMWEMGTFLNTWFHSILYTLQNLSVWGLCLWINDYVVWVSLTALVRTYFIDIKWFKYVLKLQGGNLQNI